MTAIDVMQGRELSAGVTGFLSSAATLIIDGVERDQSSDRQTFDTIDPATETFLGDDEANSLRSRPARDWRA